VFVHRLDSSALIIVNETYKGIHVYGKRSSKKRELIGRPVPALVDPATRERAQQVLRGNYRFGRRDAKRQYLLRGLVKCGLCGLNFCGNYDARMDKGY
jgi:site-specific DNA recombinase